MIQNGFMVGGSIAIDNLTYSYLSGGSNKLMGVTDAANNATSQLGDFHYNPATKQSTDYSYDGDGNLTQDNNKAITSISYNYLNLPQLIHFQGKGNISYVYDAAGEKLVKITADSMAKHSIRTLYLDGMVYQQTDTITNPGGGTDTLQFISHEEGRVRWAYRKYTTGATGYAYSYDFFEKDHLGNTRMVLTQERDTTNYIATMEAAYRATESQLFGNIASTSVAFTSMPNYQNIPSGTRYQFTNPNDSVSKVDYNGTSGQTTGPSLLLKVMSGDTIMPGVQCYYATNTLTTTNSSLNSVLNSLASGIMGTATGAAEGTLSGYTSSSGTVYSGLTSFLSTKDPGAPSGYPKAYLNWILLDDQFNYVSGSSGSVAAASTTYPANQMNTVAAGGPVVMARNGYLYVWVSNETQGWDVFFDNFSVQYKQGPVLEENHYYPFGLTMAAISDKAVKTNYAENKYRYNGGNELQNKEFSDGSGLEMYDANFRGYDPQLGRFSQIDPLADISEDWSPYSFSSDNPILLNDPLGLADDTTTLPTATVVGYKANCQTCSPRSVEAGPPPDQGSAVAGAAPTSTSDPKAGGIPSKTVLDNLLGKNPIYNLEHDIVEQPTWWQRLVNGVMYQGKNALGQEVYKKYYGGPISGVVAGANVEGEAEGAYTVFENISKRIRRLSTTNFSIGITAARFEANLAKVAGKAWELSSDGKVKTLIYNGIKYISRLSTDGKPTIDIYRGAELLQKYRLQE